MARGQISRFPIDLRRRPYNTLALPCECVIGASKCCHMASMKISDYCKKHRSIYYFTQHSWVVCVLNAAQEGHLTIGENGNISRFGLGYAFSHDVGKRNIGNTVMDVLCVKYRAIITLFAVHDSCALQDTEL